MKFRSLASPALLALSFFLATSAFAETTPPASAPAATGTTASAAAGSVSAPAQAPAETPASAPAAAPAPKKAAKLVKARVLVDSQYGKCNAVVELEEAAAKAGEAAGELDTAKAAVAYAESL